MVDLGSINRPVASQFDWTSLLQLMQQRELNELRKQEAQIDLAQKRFNLEFDQQTRDERIRSVVLVNSARESAIKRDEAETELARKLATAAEAYGQAIGGFEATTESLGTFIANSDGVATAANNEMFPRSQRSKNLPDTKTFFGRLVDRSIGEILDVRDGRALPMSEAILGYGEYKEHFRPFSNSHQDKAMQVVTRAVETVRTGIQAVPEPSVIVNSATSAENMIQQLEAGQALLGERAATLARPVFQHQEVEGSTQSVLTQANMKAIEYEKTRRRIEAGARVISSGEGFKTKEELAGVQDIISSLVRNVLVNENAGDAVVRLGEAMRSTNFIPTEELSPLFRVAADSSDPAALIKASMVYEDLRTRFADKPWLWADITKAVEDKGIFDAMEVLGSVRKAFTPIPPEDGSELTPQKYAAQVMQQVDNVMQRTTAVAEQERTRREIAPKEGEGSLPKSDFRIARLVASQEQFIGRDTRGVFTNGLLDELDLSIEDAIGVDNGAFLNEFWTRMAMARSETDEGRAKIATDEMLQRYHRGGLTSDDVVTSHHPFNVARFQRPEDNIEPEFALSYARFQLSEDLATLTTKDGEPLNLRIEDVDAVPVPGADGELQWEIYRKGQRAPLFRFRADFSTEAMTEMYGKLDKYMGQEAAEQQSLGIFSGRPQASLLHTRINQYLGPESPFLRGQQQRVTEGLQEKRRKERVFRPAQESFRYVPDELRETPQ